MVCVSISWRSSLTKMFIFFFSAFINFSPDDVRDRSRYRSHGSRHRIDPFEPLEVDAGLDENSDMRVGRLSPNVTRRPLQSPSLFAWPPLVVILWAAHRRRVASECDPRLRRADGGSVVAGYDPWRCRSRHRTPRSGRCLRFPSWCQARFARRMRHARSWLDVSNTCTGPSWFPRGWVSEKGRDAEAGMLFSLLAGTGRG